MKVIHRDKPILAISIYRGCNDMTDKVLVWGLGQDYIGIYNLLLLHAQIVCLVVCKVVKDRYFQFT